MRVITGKARGRKLKELPGLETRPTTDRVKEAMFDIVQFDIEGRRVLDLFGGTGQLGIEALSRGAASCTFVDCRREAAALIRENLETTGLSAGAVVLQCDAIEFLGRCREKFDLVLLDPPYGTDLLDQALNTLTRIDILKGNGIILCESSAERELPAAQPPYSRGREYRYGKIKLTLYRRAAQ